MLPYKQMCVAAHMRVSARTRVFSYTELCTQMCMCVCVCVRIQIFVFSRTDAHMCVFSIYGCVLTRRSVGARDPVCLGTQMCVSTHKHVLAPEDV